MQGVALENWAKELEMIAADIRVNAAALYQAAGVNLDDPATPGDPLLVRAEAVARLAHFGQKEESTGDDYIHHVERVVALVSTREEKAVAWLHDVVEDYLTRTDDTTTGPEHHLTAIGFEPSIVDAVLRLSRNWYVPRTNGYASYIEDVKMSGDSLALAVKIADLKDHLRPNCPERLRPRYEKALQELTADSPQPVAPQPTTCDHKFNITDWANHEPVGRRCSRCGSRETQLATPGDQLSDDQKAGLLAAWSRVPTGRQPAVLKPQPATPGESPAPQPTKAPVAGTTVCVPTASDVPPSAPNGGDSGCSDDDDDPRIILSSTQLAALPIELEQVRESWKTAHGLWVDSEERLTTLRAKLEQVKAERDTLQAQLAEAATQIRLGEMHRDQLKKHWELVRDAFNAAQDELNTTSADLAALRASSAKMAEGIEKLRSDFGIYFGWPYSELDRRLRALLPVSEGEQ